MDLSLSQHTQALLTSNHEATLRNLNDILIQMRTIDSSSLTVHMLEKNIEHVVINNCV